LAKVTDPRLKNGEILINKVRKLKALARFAVGV
jgi:hypothetical protein